MDPWTSLIETIETPYLIGYNDIGDIMEREFIALNSFLEQWKELGLDDNDLRELEIYLCKNPEAGSIIKGTGGLRKLRWAMGNKGKSGGIRTLYVDFAYYETTFFITVYPKNVKDNISDAERNAIKKKIQELKEEFERE